MLWGDIPTWTMIAGALIVVLANLYVLRREIAIRRAANS
jgi:hypothetical protein